MHKHRNHKQFRMLPKSADFTGPSHHQPLPENSEWLRSILKPFTGPAPIPDQNMTTSHPKSVRLTQNMLVPAIAANNIGSCLFVYLPHSKFDPIKMFIFNVGANQYLYATDIPYDQVLANNYTMGRFVSGGLEVISATVTATNSTVAGTITAAAFQELPDILNGFTYNSITTIKRNDVDVISSVPVEEGALMLAFPDGNNDFTVFNTLNSWEENGKIRIGAFYASAPATGWNAVLVAAGVVNFFSLKAYLGGTLPNNLGWGAIIIDADVGITVSPGAAGTMTISIGAIYRTVSTADWSTVTTNNASLDFFGLPATAAGNYYRIPLSGFYDTGAPLDDIVITITMSGATANWTMTNSNISVKAVQYYQEGLNSTGTVVGVQSLGGGQTLTLGGVGNFEVVPNAILQKDITTSYFGAFNPVEIDLVEHYLANSVSNGVRFVWSSMQYEMWLASGKVDKHLPMENIVTATGFGDFLSGLFKTIAPIAKMGLPLLGGALLGPMGSELGGAISGLIPESAAFKAAAYGPSRVLI